MGSDAIISIVSESLNLLKLKIYYKSHTNKCVELYIKFPEDSTEYQREECLSKMEIYIDSSISSGDLTSLFTVAKRFILENNLKYYEVYTLG